MLIEPPRAVPGGLDAELRLPVPVDVAFAYISDLRHMETWWPEHRSYRLLRGDGGEGSLYGWTYRLHGLPAAGLTRVLVCERNERFEYRAGLPGLGIRIAYRFSAEGDATRARFSLRTLLARLPGFASNAVPEATRAFALLEAALAGAVRAAA